MSSTKAGFTFSDLFAGVGGFHAALHAAGGTWAFASEIDPEAKKVYDYNWLRPLREAGAEPPEGVEAFEVSDDIVPLTDPKVRVPRTDVLAAGFPCQPFSKSGYQRGMEETRGTLFWNIARILDDPDRRPSVVLLENVRNLAGPRHRETTFATIVRTLRELGYRTSSVPAVFSPHLLPPELGGRPQVRERVFILAHYVGVDVARHEKNDAPIVTPKTFASTWDKTRWNLVEDLPLLSDEEASAYELNDDDRKWIDTWDKLLTDVAAELGPEERLPGFPIWAMEFRTVAEAEKRIDTAKRRGVEIPPWKQTFLLKNAKFYERFEHIIEKYGVIDGFPISRQKFEWQAGEHVPLSETIMHFRPSGIRCKKPDYVPALVAITQTSILGNRRRLAPREAARLQGMPEWFEFKHSVHGSDEVISQRDSASYKQMGNGVNVGAAYYVFRQYVLRHRNEIEAHIVSAVEAAPENPYREYG